MLELARLDRRGRRRCWQLVDDATRGELFGPPNLASGLHDYEQRRNRANRDRQSGEAFEEKRIGKCDQVNELGQGRFAGGESRSDYETQIRNYQEDRNSRTNHKRQVNGYMIDEIRKQQMKRKECRGEKEIIHR